MKTPQEIKKQFPSVSAADIKILLAARSERARIRQELIKVCTIQENLSHETERRGRRMSLKDIEPYKTDYKNANARQKELEKGLETAYAPVFETKLYNKQSGIYCSILEFIN